MSWFSFGSSQQSPVPTMTTAGIINNSNINGTNIVNYNGVPLLPPQGTSPTNELRRINGTTIAIPTPGEVGSSPEDSARYVDELQTALNKVIDAYNEDVAHAQQHHFQNAMQGGGGKGKNKQSLADKHTDIANVMAVTKVTKQMFAVNKIAAFQPGWMVYDPAKEANQQNRVIQKLMAVVKVPTGMAPWVYWAETVLPTYTAKMSTHKGNFVTAVGNRYKERNKGLFITFFMLCHVSR